MEEIGKLIHELFDDLKKENAQLKDWTDKLEAENRLMVQNLAKVRDIIVRNISKSNSSEEYYVSSMWRHDYKGLIDALGINEKETEEYDNL